MTPIERAVIDAQAAQLAHLRLVESIKVTAEEMSRSLIASLEVVQRTTQIAMKEAAMVRHDAGAV
ncbi:MAG: hypothetical protein DRH08_04425 [Deltaproteobacteria bacterium]|nr:MAG: hypothetical protein DRH08_04425 [Deltaproteobacteria bacterium]